MTDTHECFPRTASLESLRIQSELISLESFNPTQVFKAVTDRLPAFAGAVRSFFTDIMDPVHAPVAVVDGRSSTKALNDMKYMDVREQLVYVPAGLKVSYLEYLAALKQAEVVADKLVGETLNPLATFLAIAVSTPDQLKSIRGIAIPNFRIHDIDGPKQAIGKCFEKNGTVAKVPLSQALKRNADWPTVLHEVNELNTRFNSTSRTEVVKLVANVTGLLDRLVERVTNEPQTYALSGANLDALSKLCYNVAREIEFYSIFAYQLQVITIAVQDTAGLIDNKFAE